MAVGAPTEGCVVGVFSHYHFFQVYHIYISEYKFKVLAGTIILVVYNSPRF